MVSKLAVRVVPTPASELRGMGVATYGSLQLSNAVTYGWRFDNGIFECMVMVNGQKVAS